MAPLSLAEYYRTPAVRQRIREYCGSCVFVTGLIPGRHVRWENSPVHPASEIDTLLDAEADISRSMWDAQDLLIHVDVDYQNPDCPSLAIEHPADLFVKLEPVQRAIQQLLDELDLPLLPLMTGRGYHWTGRVPLGDPVIARLAALGPTPAWLWTHGARRPGWAPIHISELQARAYAGAGMVVEYLAHEVIRRATRRTRMPIVINGTAVGAGGNGRGCASLDFSYAGDPLDIRHLRSAFSVYRSSEALDGTASPAEEPFIAVPRAGRSTLELLDGDREPQAAAALAAEIRAELPLATRGIGNLLEAYHASPLAAFHREFHAVRAHAPEHWPQTYDRFDLSRLVPCVRVAFEHPNDLLLKPEFLQHVTRFLISEGWHPTHIAGLVHSRYARDFNWGERWTRMDARTRADFYVRIFAGMIATGLDRGVDFNCRSTQEKDMCPRQACLHDLRQNRERFPVRAA